MNTTDVEQALQALQPVELKVHDDSDNHKEHGAPGAHFSVRIVSEKFAGLSLVARHRLVYATLGDAMKQAIHALIIDAKAPGE